MKLRNSCSLICNGIALLFLVAGCLPWHSIEEKIYYDLEAIVQYEEDFAELQEPLIELEEADHELFNEIVATELSDREKISTLAEKGIENAEKRLELLDQERESIILSATEFEKVATLIAKIKDDDLRTMGEDLYTVMTHRYDVHEQLYEEYSTGIQLDQAFYQLLQQDDVSFPALESRIHERNDVYRRVYSLNEQFNALTAEYNRLKGLFYQRAGIADLDANS